MCCDGTAAPLSMPSRRIRRKSRRPKYLSLRRQLALPPPPPPPPPPAPPPEMEAAAGSSAQLDLFPQHPDHQERDPHVACLLAPDNDAADGGPTLAALLGSAGAASEEADPSPPRSASGVWVGDGEGLARRALRGRERWVFCCSSSSASSSSSSEQEASSGMDLLCCAAPHALWLKLDYDEILTAWSDRGSLYIEGEGPQIVPEIHQTTLFVDMAHTENASLWRVPDLDKGVKDGNQTERKKAESREARVMRYKEKRRSRLFSKRIRYEVRKLNAEKRPRMKGRFVKRNDDL